jgi:hypothetical protein
MIENKNPGNKTSGYYQTIAGIAYLLLSGFIYFNPKVIPMLQGEENASIRLAIIAFFGIYGAFRVFRGVKILSE